jgi:hypothetical protein
MVLLVKASNMYLEFRTECEALDRCVKEVAWTLCAADISEKDAVIAQVEASELWILKWSSLRSANGDSASRFMFVLFCLRVINVIFDFRNGEESGYLSAALNSVRVSWIGQESSQGGTAVPFQILGHRLQISFTYGDIKHDVR